MVFPAGRPFEDLSRSWDVSAVLQKGKQAERCTVG